MNQFIFKSRWIAIAFAVLTLSSVYMLVGGGDGGFLASFQDKAIDQRGEAEAQLAEIGTVREGPPPPVVEEPYYDDAEFMDDEELIDDGAGYDPTPETELEGPAPQEFINGIPVINGEVLDMEQ